MDTDLKTLERKAYFAYYNDGLIDAGLGIVFLTFSLGLIWDTPWLAGVVMILIGAVLLSRFLRTYPLPAEED